MYTTPVHRSIGRCRDALHQSEMFLQGHRTAALLQSLVSCTAWHFEISDKKSWMCPGLNFVSSIKGGHVPPFCCTLDCIKSTAATFSISDGKKWRQRTPTWVSTEQKLPKHLQPLGSWSTAACKWCWRLNCPKPLEGCNDALVFSTDNLEKKSTLLIMSFIPCWQCFPSWQSAFIKKKTLTGEELKQGQGHIFIGWAGWVWSCYLHFSMLSVSFFTFFPSKLEFSWRGGFRVTLSIPFEHLASVLVSIWGFWGLPKRTAAGRDGTFYNNNNKIPQTPFFSVSIFWAHTAFTWSSWQPKEVTFGGDFQRDWKECHQQLSVLTDPVGAAAFSQSKEFFNKPLLRALWEPLRAAPSQLPSKWAKPRVRSEDSSMQEMPQQLETAITAQ